MCNKKENVNIDLSNIKMANTKYCWDESIGAKIPFTYNNYSNTLIIKDCFRKVSPNGHVQPYVSITCEGIDLGEIQTVSLINGKIGKLISQISFYWEYEIGENLIDDKRNITIIDRKLDNSIQYYKIRCNKCGFDSSKYYSAVTDEYKEEYWISYYSLKNNYGCPCCKNIAIVEGLNDISTTHKWMEKYFTNKNDAKHYSYCSNRKKSMTCPYCGEIKKYQIYNLYTYGYLPCICSDGVSIPNKIAYYTFNSIKGKIDYYEREYSPEWAKPFRYDNYLEIDNKKYIIEMDGGLGHGIREYKTNKKDVKGLKNDIIKEKLAKENNIILFRVDCNSCSPYDYKTMLYRLVSIIKENIFYDIDNFINEEFIMKKSLSNLIIDVCYYKNNNQNFTNNEIASIFNLHKDTVKKYLKVGREYGWCD